MSLPGARRHRGQRRALREPQKSPQVRTGPSKPTAETPGHTGKPWAQVPRGSRARAGAGTELDARKTLGPPVALLQLVCRDWGSGPHSRWGTLARGHGDAEGTALLGWTGVATFPFHGHEAQGPGESSVEDRAHMAECQAQRAHDVIIS